jgi:hypothetical protein
LQITGDEAGFGEGEGDASARMSTLVLLLFLLKAVFGVLSFLVSILGEESDSGIFFLV